jgi:hypothetical protein
MNSFEKIYTDAIPRESTFSIEKCDTIERDLTCISKNIASLASAADMLIDHAIDIKEEIQKVKRKIHEKGESKTAAKKPKKNNRSAE